MYNDEFFTFGMWDQAKAFVSLAENYVQAHEATHSEKEAVKAMSLLADIVDGCREEILRLREENGNQVRN